MFGLKPDRRLFALLLSCCAMLGAAPSASESFSLLPEQVYVRIGETLAIEAVFTNDPNPAYALRWSASVGTIAANGLEADFTAPENAGWAIVTAGLWDGAVLLAEQHCALLVYHQFAIIKADDYVSWDGETSVAWLDFVRYMTEERRLPYSVGLITSCLELFQCGSRCEFVETLRAVHYSGYGEVWHHGYDHQGDLTAQPIWTEFFNTDLAYQREHLDRGLALSRSVLGFPLTAFGPPFGMSDSTTTAVVDASPDLLVWMDGQPDAETLVLPLRNYGLVENPVGTPNWLFFQTQYSAA